MKELHDLLEDVNDEKTFLIFASSLMEDRMLHESKHVDEVGSSGDWANNNITNFLEAAIAWAEDSDFGVHQEPELEDNKWKQFAVFLYCGKIYE